MLVHPNFDPVAIALGPIKVHWYGLSYLVGFTLAWALGRYRARQADWPWNKDQISDLLFYAVLGSFSAGASAACSSTTSKHFWPIPP